MEEVAVVEVVEEYLDPDACWTDGEEEGLYKGIKYSQRTTYSMAASSFFQSDLLLSHTCFWNVRDIQLTVSDSIMLNNTTLW